MLKCLYLTVLLSKNLLLQRSFDQFDIDNPDRPLTVDDQVEFYVVEVLSLLQEKRSFNGCPFHGAGERDPDPPRKSFS